MKDMLRYHVWFSTKRRKWLLQGDVSELAEQAIWEVAASDGIRLLECKAAIDHVHLILELDSPEALPAAMKALKGKSAHLVFQRIPELKLDAGTRHLWQRGYGRKLVEPGAEATVLGYIQTQMDRLEKFAR
jgi:putative transposase